MNFMKTDYELKRSKRKTLSLTVTKDLKVSVKVSFLSLSETAGLGMKAKEPSFS